MNLNIPYYQQDEKFDCGPIALKMVYAYFKEEKSNKEIKHKLSYKEGKGLYSLQLALVSKQFGFDVEFYTKTTEIKLPEDEFSLTANPFLKDEILINIKKMYDTAKMLNVKIYEQKITIENILTKINDGYVPIILVDYNKLFQKEGAFQGHFIIITGYDVDNIIIHSPETNLINKNIKINKQVFDNARKAIETDEEIIFIKKVKYGSGGI
ncbi:hypothetical protein GW835_04185 [archaeon]|nr:hypothetical protein [archaeon]NCP79738.1 hypothetical protein [archaeon]NCP98372.1 hypothetical protein [archaeon]NCQ07504.1 hypothetical protein [archaeon]NCQ51295.1 hypothetical protein [archaeon]